MVIDHIPVEQIECLSTAIYHEARGESKEGQELVAQVIKNRVNDKYFPDTYCAVINQKGQFTFKQNKPILEKEAYNKARAIAINVIKGNYEYGSHDSIIGYHNLSVTPKWAQRFNIKLKVGNHVFYGTNRQTGRNKC